MASSLKCFASCRFVNSLSYRYLTNSSITLPSEELKQALAICVQFTASTDYSNRISSIFFKSEHLKTIQCNWKRLNHFNLLTLLTAIKRNFVVICKQRIFILYELGKIFWQFTTTKWSITFGILLLVNSILTKRKWSFLIIFANLVSALLKTIGSYLSLVEKKKMSNITIIFNKVKAKMLKWARTV